MKIRSGLSACLFVRLLVCLFVCFSKRNEKNITIEKIKSLLVTTLFLFVCLFVFCSHTGRKKKEKEKKI